MRSDSNQYQCQQSWKIKCGLKGATYLQDVTLAEFLCRQMGPFRKHCKIGRCNLHLDYVSISDEMYLKNLMKILRRCPLSSIIFANDSNATSNATSRNTCITWWWQSLKFRKMPTRKLCSRMENIFWYAEAFFLWDLIVFFLLPNFSLRKASQLSGNVTYLDIITIRLPNCQLSFRSLTAPNSCVESYAFTIEGQFKLFFEGISMCWQSNHAYNRFKESCLSAKLHVR